jgi:hypothetical protein
MVVAAITLWSKAAISHFTQKNDSFSAGNAEYQRCALERKGTEALSRFAEMRSLLHYSKDRGAQIA